MLPLTFAVKFYSTTVTVTAKFHYFQIPHSSQNYMYTLRSNSNTYKFQDNWFTAKFNYLQIHATLLQLWTTIFSQKTIFLPWILPFVLTV